MFDIYNNNLYLLLASGFQMFQIIFCVSICVTAVCFTPLFAICGQRETHM